jgi:hypothetical protein
VQSIGDLLLSANLEIILLERRCSIPAGVLIRGLPQVGLAFNEFEFRFAANGEGEEKETLTARVT